MGEGTTDDKVGEGTTDDKVGEGTTDDKVSFTHRNMIHVKSHWSH